jgi:phage terminase large subunit-like protein
LARPAKSLAVRIGERRFKAREHRALLEGPLVGPERLQDLQRRYQEAGSERVRRAVAVEYEHALRDAPAEVAQPVDVTVPAAEFFPLFRHVKGPAAGEPFRLEDWQVRFVEDFERRDEAGLRIFKRALLGVPRGNGKSPVAAALALRELVQPGDEPDVILAAGSRDQARVAYAYARGFAESGPLAPLLEVGRHEIRCRGNGGVLRTVSADGFVAHGLNPSAIVLDELHVWRTEKQRELFEALDSAIHKRPGAFWLALTTAGSDKGSLLGRLYVEMLERLDVERPHEGLAVGRDEFNGSLLYWYGAPDDASADDDELADRVNPASWVTRRELRRQREAPSMQPATFRRLHMNVWCAPDVDRWIDSRRWDELADKTGIPDGATVYVGADGSRSYDTTAVGWAHPDGDRIRVGCRVFSVRPEVPHHVLHPGGTIDFGDVEGFLLELASRYDVREIRYDPRFLQPVMDALAGRLPGGVAPIEPYSAVHRQALAALERAVLEGNLRHPGDPVVDAQVAAVAVDRFDNGDPRRIRKLDRTRPIDAAVALALAVHGATLDAGGGSVYDARPALVLDDEPGDDAGAGRYVDGELVHV